MFVRILAKVHVGDEFHRPGAEVELDDRDAGPLVAAGSAEKITKAEVEAAAEEEAEDEPAPRKRKR